MAVKYVDEFEFPSSDRAYVKGYYRGGRREPMAKGGKVEKTMHEFKEGALHSGSKTGPLVQNRKQAVAIALSQARKAGEDVPMKKASGGIVSAPDSGMRKPRPSNAERAQRYAEQMAMRPNRGPRIGAHLGVAKPAMQRMPAPKAMPMGALQSAGEPMIKPPHMARGGPLTAKQRNALPASSFAGPDRSYPVPDKSHAANAKARATQAVNAGRMSPSTKAKIDARANKVLKR